MKKIIRKSPQKTIEVQTTLLFEDEGILVVRSQLINPSKDLVVDRKTVLEKGFSAVVFEFRRRYYGIAKIYDKNKNFTGFFCNINTPIERFEDGYKTTDLFLDLWVYPDGTKYIVLDEDEFEEALKENWLDEKLARKARETLGQLIEMVKEKKFPPKFVKDFDDESKI